MGRSGGIQSHVDRWKSTDVSDEHISSVFKIEEQPKQETQHMLAVCFMLVFLLALVFDIEDGGDMFIRNVGYNRLPGVISQKITLRTINPLSLPFHRSTVSSSHKQTFRKRKQEPHIWFPTSVLEVNANTVHSLFYKRPRQHVVGITTGYGLDNRSSIPGNANCSLLHSVQTGSGAHPASYPMGTADSFPWG
jgi:hypothetical protein